MFRKLAGILSGVLLLAFLQGFSCDSGTEPDEDEQQGTCESAIVGPLVLPAGGERVYELQIGGAWDYDTEQSWSLSPGPGTVDAIAGQDFKRTIIFEEPGAQVIGVELEDMSEGAECEDHVQFLEVLVTEELHPCGIAIHGDRFLSAGETGHFQLLLGEDWYGTDYSAEWTVSSGPPGWSIEDSGLESADVRFAAHGDYTVQVELESLESEPDCDEAQAEIQVTVIDPDATGIPAGTLDSPWPDPDGCSVAVGDPWTTAIGAPAPCFVATAHGVSCVNLSDGNIVAHADLSGSEALADPPLGCVPMAGGRNRNPRLNLFEFGTNSAFVHHWNTSTGGWDAFPLYLEFNVAVTDAVHLLGGEDGLLYVKSDNTVVEYSWDEVQSAYVKTLRFGQISGTGPVASAVGSGPGGSLIAATGGEPGKLWLWHDPQDGLGFDLTELGEVGDTPRRLRVLDGIGVLTNFDSDEISILTWDGAADAVLLGNHAVGDGPVGVDLLPRSGGGVYALTTGWFDHTYTITEIDAAGAVVASTTNALPAGMLQPAHGVWLHDADESFLVSCFGSDQLFVERRVP